MSRSFYSNNRKCCKLFPWYKQTSNKTEQSLSERAGWKEFWNSNEQFLKSILTEPPHIWLNWEALIWGHPGFIDLLTTQGAEKWLWSLEHKPLWLPGFILG